MTTVILVAITIVGLEFLRRAKGPESRLIVALIFLVAIALIVGG